MQKPDIQRLIEFQTFLLKFQKIERSIALPGPGEHKENDVEHSYFLAMAAWYLAPHFPQIDRDKAIRYALVYDLVETYAGDTNAFGTIDALSSWKQSGRTRPTC
jgi:5'-deoxynucleotidase YfbR-like HD superfamily hydrolase